VSNFTLEMYPSHTSEVTNSQKTAQHSFNTDWHY